FDERVEVPAQLPYTVTIPPTRQDGTPVEAIVVEIVVTDPQGATHRDEVFIDVTNRPPQPALQVQGFASPKGGYPLETTVRVVAQSSDPDGDGTTYAWRYYPASGSQEANVVWSQVQADIYELGGDVAGEWMV